MEEAKAKKIISKNLDVYKRAFGIPHWRITVECDWSAQSIGETMESHGRVEYMAEYERATIQLDCRSFDDEDELLTVLRHELFHLISWPYSIYRNSAWCPSIESGSDDDAREDTMWRVAQEQFVRNMERMYHGMCQGKGHGLCEANVNVKVKK